MPQACEACRYVFYSSWILESYQNTKLSLLKEWIEYLHIGINDIATEGIWQYATGGDLVYTNWRGINSKNGTTWNDGICSHEQPSICEIKTTTTATHWNELGLNKDKELVSPKSKKLQEDLFFCGLLRISEFYLNQYLFEGYVYSKVIQNK